MDRVQGSADDFPPPFHHNGGHHRHQPPDHYLRFNGARPTASSIQMMPPGQKRQFGGDYDGHVKLYVLGIPRTATEQDIADVFGEHGRIIEIVILRDKRTGLQQECCFVKYAAVDHAEQAIGALHGLFSFAKGMVPITVKYAVGERERIGSSDPPLHKLYVSGMNRQALKWDIEEIFSPFGVIEDIYIVRDEFKQPRGYAFIQYSCKEMAISAIEALNGTYVMRGCDQPLVVRFADPKRQKMDSRPPPCFNSSNNVHGMPSEMQHAKSSLAGNATPISTTCSGSAVNGLNSTPQLENPIPPECDWSEHVSPDGELYYYNCVTCESKWEMPEEYRIYERELENIEQCLSREEPNSQIASGGI